MTDQRPNSLPVRKVGESPWEVLIVDHDLWLSCADESDARAIAAAPVLKYHVVTESRCDEAFARELERTAEAFEQYQMGYGSRSFEHSASDIRKKLE